MTGELAWCIRAALALAYVPYAFAGQTAVQTQSGPQPYALRSVRLAGRSESALYTLVLRAGRIESITDVSAPPPVDARVVEGAGQLALPAFIDTYTHAGCLTPEPIADRDRAPKPVSDVWVDMRDANRKGIEPSFRAVDVLAIEAEAGNSYRGLGFGHLVAAPHGQLLSGTSMLATTRDAAPRDTIVVAELFVHAGFRCTGAGYPTTLMGSIAQLRQFFLDADHARALSERYAAGKPGRRPPYDAELSSFRAARDAGRRVVCEADTAGDIDRWLRLSKELGVDIAISGGRDAWRHAAELAARHIPVFLTLDWGEEVEDPHAKDKSKEQPAPAPPEAGQSTGAAQKTDAPPQDTAPEVTEPDSSAAKPVVDDASAKSKEAAAADEWRYTEPMRVREEKRRLWEESRDCAARLAQAGVPFAFGSGRSSPKDLFEQIRKLVEAGLPADVALQRLTAGAAELLGADRHIGRIDVGFDATLALWTANPLSTKDAKLAWLFVDGAPYEFDLQSKALEGKPGEGVDATGTWVLDFDTPESKPATAVLSMDKAGAVKGTIRYRSPVDDTDISGDFAGQVAGQKLQLEGRMKFGAFEAEVQVSAELEGETMTGESRWKWSGGEDARHFKGRRSPKHDGGAH